MTNLFIFILNFQNNTLYLGKIGSTIASNRRNTDCKLVSSTLIASHKNSDQ